MELVNLLRDTKEVKLEEIEVSHRVHEVQHTIQSELRTIEHFAQDRLHCAVHLNTYVTIDGHTSVQVNLRRNKTGLTVCGQLLVLPGRNVPLALKKYMHRAAQPLLEEIAQCQRCCTKHFGKGCFRFAHQDIYDLIRITVLPMVDHERGQFKP